MIANQPTKDRGHDDPPFFICPLTLNVMMDPVIDRDGNCYERSAIVEWLAKKGTSPVTCNPLVKDDLVANRTLRDAIHSHMGPEWSTKAEQELRQQHQPAPRTVAPMGTRNRPRNRRHSVEETYILERRRFFEAFNDAAARRAAWYERNGLQNDETIDNLPARGSLGGSS